MNYKAIGICLVGNYNAVRPPQALWNKALYLVTYLMFMHNINKNNVVGHNEFKKTSCPGKLFNMDQFRSDL